MPLTSLEAIPPPLSSQTVPLSCSNVAILEQPLLGRLNELMIIKHLAKSLIHGKCSLNDSCYNNYYRIKYTV